MAGVTINIGANTQQLQQSFQQSQQAVTAALAQITAAMQRMTGQSTQSTNTIVQNNQHAAQSFTNTANQAHTATGHLGEGLTELIKKAGEFAIAYLAAKEAIEQVKQTIEGMDAIDKLSTNMGVTKDAAAAVIQGLRSVDVTLAEFQTTLNTTTSLLSSNEKMLTKWGITTRDQNGHLLDQKALFENVRARIEEYKDGTDRAAAAQKLWGVDLDTANKLLQLNSQAMEAAEQKAKMFGNTLSEEGAEKMEAFKRASGDLTSAVQGMRQAFYEELLPAITSVMNFISANAPTALGVLSNIGKGVVDVFNWMADTVGYVMNTLGQTVHDTLSQSGANEVEWGQIIANVASVVQAAVAVAVGAITALWQTITTTMQLLRTSLVNTAEAVEMAFKRDWEGVKAVWRRNLSDISDIVVNYGKTITGDAAKVAADVQRALMGGGLGNPNGGLSPFTPSWLGGLNQGFGDVPKGFRNITNETIRGGGGGGDASALLKAQTELMKAELQAQLNELKTSLQGQKDVLDAALKDNTISYQNYYDNLNAMAREETEKEVALLQAQIDAQKALMAKAPKEEDKIRIQAQIVTLQSQINVLKEKEGQIEAKNAEALKDKQKEMAKMHADLAAQVAQASGVTDVGVQMKAIEAQYKDMRDRMAAESDVEGMSLLDKLMGFKEAELKLKAFQEKFDQAQTEMNTKVTELDTLGKQQGLTDYTMEQKKLELYGQEVDKLIEIKNAQLEVAEATYGANSAQVAGIKATIAQLQNLKTPISQVSKQIKEAITDQIADFFTTVMNGTKSLKEALKDLVNGIVQAINKIVAEALAKKLMMGFETSGAGGWIGGLFGGGGGGGDSGGGGGFLSSIFGSLFGGRATGGSVATGMPYLIGENGPELFVPRTSGDVVPNHLARQMALQGNSQPAVNVSITTPDPHTFRKTRQQWMADLSRSVSRASNRNN